MAVSKSSPAGTTFVATAGFSLMNNKLNDCE
jgi:hypothetical protein